jgi:DHA2 family multidrug resistance protein
MPRPPPGVSPEQRDAPFTSGSRRAISPWFVGAAVVIPTLIGVVGTTIVGVARPYVAGGQSAPATDSEWVITSYLAANAFILPITGWLSAHFGRHNYFLGSIAVITIASELCGRAASLPQLVLFRVIQGLAASLLAPIVGPTLGGWQETGR